MVSNRSSSAFLGWVSAILLLATYAQAASLTLGCDPVAKAVAYRWHWGVASGAYTNYLTTTGTVATISNLVPGATYYFAVTDIATNGVESDNSNEVRWKVGAINSLPATNWVRVFVQLQKATNISGPFAVLTNLLALSLTNPSEPMAFYRSAVAISETNLSK